jgi:phospholipid transport system substrate-binding protein
MRYVTFAISLVLFLSPAVWAATPTDALRQVFAQADRILADPETEERPLERLLAVRKLVNDALDSRGATVLAFGRHWRTATPADQQEFTQLLGDMLERSYISRLASSQASLGGGAQIQYLGESIEGDEAFVWTAVARRNSGEILLGYRMIERDGRWKVRDVIVDGVSVAANYRAQIERVLEAASVPELLVQMREKVGRVASPLQTESIVETAPPTETVAVVDTSTPVLTAAVEEAPPPAPVAPVAERIPPEPARLAPPAERRDTSVTAAPPRVVTRVTKAYWLRLGTVEAMEESGRLAALLAERKLVVAVESAGSAVEPLALSVRVGPFQDATEAVLKLLELQTKGHDPRLVAERE